MKNIIESNDANITTIKQAKELCKALNGRLPRIGYEMIISHGITQVTGLQGKKYNAEYTIYLQNNSGYFRVWQYTSVNPVWYAK